MKKCLSFLTILSLVLFVCVFSGQAEDFRVDFSSSTGFGVSENTFQIDGINLDLIAINPLTGERTVINQTLSVLWQWDQGRLALVPIRVGEVQQGEARLQVQVTDALTGQPLPGATVTVNNNSLQTDENGMVIFDHLPQDTLQVIVSAPGYISQTIPVDLSSGEASIGVSLLSSSDNGTLRGDIRIVLTWGEHPEDLDSHLTGPMANNPQERFHVYYGDTNNCNNFPCNENIPAWLDVDDTTSFGPETITILKKDGSFVPGLYRYSVHHFSGTGNIPSSGAVVKVFVGDQLYRTFYPPQTNEEVGDDWVWTVFELEISPDQQMSIREVGTYYGPVSSGEVQQMKTYLGIPVSSENPELFRNLPVK